MLAREADERDAIEIATAKTSSVSLVTSRIWVDQLLRAASAVSSIWSLAAFGIAAILFFALHHRKGRKSASANVILLLIAGLALIPSIGHLYVKQRRQNPSVYRVRALVLSNDGIPVDQAQIWSSLGGEPKMVSGGWQFDIPSSSVPTNRVLTVYARVPSKFLQGAAEFKLTDDYQPQVTVRLIHPNANIRGVVVDSRGRAVSQARVSVVGFGSEVVETDASGGFVLAAHASNGQLVEIHVEKSGFGAETGWFPAGDSPTEIVLRR